MIYSSPPLAGFKAGLFFKEVSAGRGEILQQHGVLQAAEISKIREDHDQIDGLLESEALKAANGLAR